MHLFTSNSKAYCKTYILVTVFLISTFSVLTEGLIRNRIEPVHTFYKFLQLFRDTTMTNAIFGDSHSAYGLTGHKNFVNLAFGGDGFLMISERIKEFYATRKPGKVIIQINPHHFSRSYQLRRNIDKKFFQLLRNFDVFTPRIFLPIHRKELFGYWKILLTGGIFESKNPIQSDGSRPNLSKITYLNFPKNLKGPGSRRTAFVNEPIAEFKMSLAAKVYGEIIDYLIHSDAKVCLVSLPVTMDLQIARKNNKRYTLLSAFIHNLARGKNIPYIELNNLDLPDSMFSDFDHLNILGAQNITADILKRCFPKRALIR